MAAVTAVAAPTIASASQAVTAKAGNVVAARAIDPARWRADADDLEDDPPHAKAANHQDAEGQSDDMHGSESEHILAARRGGVLERQQAHLRRDATRGREPDGLA